jgi:hypothetical protein
MPEAPDPKEQGAAATAGNVSTATANAALGNINEYTPQGSVIRKQTGTSQIWDENLGKNITVPTYSAYQTYSKPEEAIYQAGAKNRLGVNKLAGTMIGQVGKAVNKGIDYSALPKAGSTANINLPKYTQFTSGPQLQTSIADAGSINRNIANAGQINREFGQTQRGVNYDLPGAEDFSKDRQKYEDALMARMNPQLQQERDILNQQALNQGLMPGSEAYNRMVDQAGRQANDARYGAILNAGTEQQRMFDMGLAGANFQNAAQQQEYLQQLGRGSFTNAAQAQQYQQNAADAAFGNAAQAQQWGQNADQARFGNTANQQMYDNLYRSTAGNNLLQDQTFNAQSSLFGLQNTERGNALYEQNAAINAPIDRIGALMSGGPVSNPQYVGANMPQLANVDYAGLMQQRYENDMAGYNAQSANSNNLIGGAGSLFASIIGACDIRLKKNIVPAGVVDGHNIYEFDYIDPQDGVGRSVGVMAQEVMQTRPDAVLRRPDGMLMVNYSVLFGGAGG